MIIFLLCIPLIIFIAAEGAIIYLLINRIIEALWEEGFSSSTLIDAVTPSLTAIMYVLGLILFSGILIWIYIRFVIISTIRKRKKEKTQNSGKNKNSGNENEVDDYENNNFIKETEVDVLNKSARKKRKRKTNKK